MASQDIKNQPSFDDLPDSAFVRKSSLIPAVLPISDSTFWRMVREKRFPASVKFGGPRVTAWSVSDVRKWLALQAAGDAGMGVVGLAPQSGVSNSKAGK
jgi:predicted DNA-binding transcriptional regulator AlpA